MPLGLRRCSLMLQCSKFELFDKTPLSWLFYVCWFAWGMFAQYMCACALGLEEVWFDVAQHLI